jgi:hypothetical protein
MPSSDWIPTREQDLAERWKEGLSGTAKQAAVGWDAAECAGGAGKITAFLTARTAYEAVNSTGNRIAKDEAKGETVDAMRDFANSSIRFNKKMSDADKLVYGIRPADTAPAHHGTPAAQPGTAVENTRNHFEHLIRAINPERGDRSKPADAYGVRYAWQAGGEKPASGEDLPKSKFSRKTSRIVRYTEADKRKTAYYSTCYENSRGDTGPWSPVEEAVIG